MHIPAIGRLLLLRDYNNIKLKIDKLLLSTPFSQSFPLIEIDDSDIIESLKLQGEFMVTLAPTHSDTHTNSVILHNISWNTFERILLETGGDRHNRFTYNQGILEIMTPLMPHEHNKRLIEKIIDTLVEELNLNVKSTGSLTCKREDLARGVEPDSSFYIQNEPIMRNKTSLDLTQDPPPDLVIEVDYASSSIDKLPIYLALGVPEVWRYDQPVMQIYSLSEDKYIPGNGSPTFGNLPLNTEIPQFLASSLQVGEVSMIKNFRSWLKTQIS